MSAPTTPERNRANAREEDRQQRMQISPDARRTPQPPQEPPEPEIPVAEVVQQNVVAPTNRELGQRARRERERQQQQQQREQEDQPVAGPSVPRAQRALAQPIAGPSVQRAASEAAQPVAGPSALSAREIGQQRRRAREREEKAQREREQRERQEREQQERREREQQEEQERRPAQEIQDQPQQHQGHPAPAPELPDVGINQLNDHRDEGANVGAAGQPGENNQPNQDIPGQEIEEEEDLPPGGLDEAIFARAAAKQERDRSGAPIVKHFTGRLRDFQAQLQQLTSLVPAAGREK
ncbi:hypothetical protein BDV93DRAFT_609730 [Ceratobasidium sp. AG-I]|nr:hypothetical protein BDV93DRAFT_609730 [Ceratobasidium sp. AG-I]